MRVKRGGEKRKWVMKSEWIEFEMWWIMLALKKRVVQNMTTIMRLFCLRVFYFPFLAVLYCLLVSVEHLCIQFFLSPFIRIRILFHSMITVLFIIFLVFCLVFRHCVFIKAQSILYMCVCIVHVYKFCEKVLTNVFNRQCK